MLHLVPPQGPSISFVLLAYNEEESIASAIEDCQRFGKQYLKDYEVIVVDDGSRDCTSDIIRSFDDGDVRLVHHSQNLGMGASMRDGYHAATKNYIAHLPGDRQVRPDALLPMLDRVTRKHVVLSTFKNPPSGQGRALMSRIFRVLTRHVGNMKINFAGTYLFHRDWLTTLPMEQADSNTFLFSFQLLELMRRHHASFSDVQINTYMREHGQSREATVARIANMFFEIGKSRVPSDGAS